MVKVFAGSVRPDSIGVEFDDERLVANAGLILIATLSKRLGIESLVDKTVRLGERAGASRRPRAPARPGIGHGDQTRLGRRRGPRRKTPGDRH